MSSSPVSRRLARTGRRRIATRRLTRATSTGIATVRRPVSTRHAPAIHDLVELLI